MKILQHSILVLLVSNLIFAQSIVIGTGSSIEVGAGSDICAGIYGDITGELIGSGTQCNEFPLPVELSLFTASVNDQSVNLKWITSTEVNNYGFEIERKSNSNQNVTNEWNKIGFVTGNGNSNSAKSYSFTDSYPAGGSKFSYRLKQIDNDGQFEYSEVVEVELVPEKFELSQNFPNPFNPTTKIKWQTPVSVHQSLKVYDVLGNEVATLVDEFKEAGKYDLSFDASDLTSGVYFYKLQAGSFVETKKMLLIK